MVRKLSCIEPMPKVRALFQHNYFALIIVIVVIVYIIIVKHQLVLINTCRRQENQMGSSSI